jgi:hypothetical protein
VFLGNEDAWTRVPGHENVGKPKPKKKDARNWQQKTRDYLNETGRKYLGPHAEPVMGLLGMASEFTDAADLRDAMQYGGKMGGAIQRGDWWGAAGAAPWMLAASGAAMLPGVSVGAADEAGDMARKGFDVWHGSPKAGLTELMPSPEGTGALGPGVYASPFQNVAGRYGDNVYQFTTPNDLFLGAGNRWDDIPIDVSSYQVWRDQVARLAAANPEQADMIKAAGDKMLYDGYPFFRELAYRMGSKEAAQELYKRAGFKGLTAMVDGPEVVMFDRVPLPGGAK